MSTMAALLTIAEAQARVLSAARRLSVEEVEIDQALDRVLAHDVLAAGEVPSFRSSAMDGYAVRAGASGRTLSVTGESRAGAPFCGGCGEGEAIRISTGAAVPADADAVIRQEDVTPDGPRVRTMTDVGPGANIRAAGEDMRAAAVVLSAGTVLHAGELGAAVAAGLRSVTVSRRPRACVLCTGDELRAAGDRLGPGQIHNSNAPMLTALAARCGAVVSPARRLPDDRQATEAGVGTAIEGSDVVILTGGVSVGPHDHVKPALSSLGVREQFWGVAMQPGRPTWFGTTGETLVFGLPGNPVSAVVTFSLFARLAFAAIQGARPEPPLDAEAVLGEPVRQRPTREQAIRVRLARVDGATVAYPREQQDSHIVTSLIGPGALALIPPGAGALPKGTRVALAELVR
jgi:molybdopterin molybdotransferase